MRINMKLVIGILLVCLLAAYLFYINNKNVKGKSTMAVAYMGNPILYKRTDDVTDMKSSEVTKMSAKLKDALTQLQATGFAAPQLLSPLRMMIISVSAERAKKFGYDQEIPTTVLINPVVKPLSNEITMTWEGCYSIPKMMGLVPRYQHIEYSGYTPDGKFITREATGFHAFIVQHEYDHLNGILYPMLIKDFSKFGYVDEFANQLPKELIAEYKN
jgi:peptide deformylase